MDVLLKKYCLNDSANGLMLLDMPTGMGKTYNVVQFIKDYLRNNPTRNIFFVTTLKKNLDDPFGKLQEEFKNDPILSDKMIRLVSNKDYVKENFSKVKNDISKIYEIKKSEEFKALSSMIDANLPADVYADVERKFRRLVSGCLSRRFKSKEERLSNIKNNNEWKWVGILYPVVFVNEKRVFFATMKKLINQFDTLVENSTRLYENKIFQESIVFIDEVDATKKDIEDMIVDNGVDKSINYLDLFRNIKICLDNHSTIPANIFDNVENKPNHMEAFKKNISLFDDIDKEYNLSLHYKSDGFEEERFVLFSDLTHNNYTTGEKNVIAKFDKKANVQRLSLVENNSDRSLYEALDKVKGAISYFTRFIGILSRSYYLNRKRRDEQRKDGAFGEFTEFHAIDTVLDSLHLQGDALNIIRNRVISNTFKFYKSKNDVSIAMCDDITYYATGFSHYKFVDDYSHDNTTVIQKYDFEETPEGVFYDICSRAKVVGVSATATYNTVLGNYDIGYLRWKLQERYFEPDAQDRARLANTFHANISGYSNVAWNVFQTNTSSKEKPLWENVLKDKEAIEHISQITSWPDKNAKSNSHYNEVRYYKIALAYKMFEGNNIQSFLSLLSKAVEKDNRRGALQLETLEEMFSLISQDMGKSFDKETLCVLTSESFEDRKNELLSALAEGKRRFIISTYATLGAGQNLQFKIPSSRTGEVVKVNDTRTESDEMDIDGIFLDRPTMIVNLPNEDESNDIHRVFQMEYLHQVHAISNKEKIIEIKNSYDSIDNPDNKVVSPLSFSSLKDFKVCATKTLVQGMGRKCRTPNRGKAVYILADSEIREVLDNDTLSHENRMFNPEMMKLVELFDLKQEETVKDRVSEIAIEDAMISNKKIRSLLTRCFDHVWNDEDIKLWQGMREYAMKNPTISKEEWEKCPYRYHYITLGRATNHYYFKQTGDFDVISNISMERIESACAVSPDEVNLSSYFKDFPALKRHFEKKGYAVEFEENDYIMSPPFYQNIYKGALGEEIGKFFLESSGIVLEELDAKEYEMFDFKVAGKPVYVDFKYWKESTRFTVEEYHKKVIEKSKKCGDIEYVLIINVRDDGSDNVNTYPNENFKIVEMPLICEGKQNAKAINKIKEIYEFYSN